MRFAKLMILAVLLALGVHAGDTCNSGKTITIDARTKRLEVPNDLDGCTCIRIRVINKQPFLYTYAVDVNQEEIAETGLTAFLPFFGPLVSDLLTPPKADVKGVADLGPNSTPTGCPALKNQLQAALGAVGQANNDLTSALVAFRTSYNSAADDVNNAQNTLTSAIASTAALKTAAATLVAVKLPGFSDIDARTTTLAEKLKDLRAALDAFSTNPTCKDSDYPHAENLYTTISFIYLPNLQDRLSTLRAKVTDLRKAINIAKDVLADPRAFEQEDIKGPFSKPTKLTISVTATDKDGKKTEIAKKEFTFGIPRFKLAGGFVTGFLETRSYARVQSNELGADGKPLIKVGRSDSGNFRYLPMAFLHTRLGDACDKEWRNWYFSVGATAKPDNKGTAAEYLFGLSRVFADQHVFVTGGVYIGKSQVLQGGLTEGARIPADISELPISKEYTARFGIAISFAR